jgi:hypothetical protein
MPWTVAGLAVAAPAGALLVAVQGPVKMAAWHRRRGARRSARAERGRTRYD